MKSSSNEAISTSTMTVKRATIIDSADVSTRKRRQNKVDLELTDSTSQSQTKGKLLNVTCALKFSDKYSYYTQVDYGSVLRQSVGTMNLPTTICKTSCFFYLEKSMLICW